MTHNVTGLKYFCKTAQLTTLQYYKGSGHYWKRHLKIHGRDISVGVLGVYFDEARCRNAAKEFSELHDIVENSAWANLIAENGIDGAPAGVAHPMFGKPSSSLGQKRPWVSRSGADNPMWGKPSPMRGKHNVGASKAHKGRPRPIGGGKKPHAVIRIGDVEIRYASVADAARALGKTRAGINRCCSGKAKTAHGFKWRYAEEEICQ